VNDLAPTPGLGVWNALWTGQEILIPASGSLYGGPGGTQPGSRLDPLTGARKSIRAGPVDSLGPRYVWTGAALVAFDTRTLVSSSRGSTYPGAAAVWNPAGNSWTRLPAAPLSGGGASVAVWTGRELLIWGQLNGATKGERKSSPQTAGIRFGS
jgi:hypothetical protein